jgi:urease alpha subunit
LQHHHGFETVAGCLSLHVHHHHGTTRYLVLAPLLLGKKLRVQYAALEKQLDEAQFLQKLKV